MGIKGALENLFIEGTRTVCRLRNLFLGQQVTLDLTINHKQAQRTKKRLLFVFPHKTHPSMSSINLSKVIYLGSFATFVVCRIPERDDALVWYPWFHSFPFSQFFLFYQIIFFFSLYGTKINTENLINSFANSLKHFARKKICDDEATIAERLKLWKAATLLSWCWHLTNWNRQVVHKTAQ